LATTNRLSRYGHDIFDADGDHDLDLFIARGSAAFGAVPEAAQDVLFINDGKGKFSATVNALPNLQSNGSCVSAGDFDKDGDIDLFVGGRSLPIVIQKLTKAIYSKMKVKETMSNLCLFRLNLWRH
jgi:hypothetical protein